jgi:hypothetical protein
VPTTELALLENTEPWNWPTDAGEQLLTLLTEPGIDADDRLLAATLAGETLVMDDAIASALLVLLGDSQLSEELRAQAALSLGPSLEQAELDALADIEDLELPEELSHVDLQDGLLSPKILGEIKQRLRAVVDDASAPQLVRRRALESAVRAAEDWHEDAVRRAWGEADPAWRLTAVFCMRFIGGFEAQIVESLATDDAELLYEAVLAAGTWAIDEAWPRVRALLDQTGDRDLLLAAIESAPQIRPEEALELLAPFADHDDEELSEAAHDMMAMVSGAFDDDDEEVDEVDEIPDYDDFEARAARGDLDPDAPDEEDLRKDGRASRPRD